MRQCAHCHRLWRGPAKSGGHLVSNSSRDPNPLAKDLELNNAPAYTPVSFASAWMDDDGNVVVRHWDAPSATPITVPRRPRVELTRHQKAGLGWRPTPRPAPRATTDSPGVVAAKREAATLRRLGRTAREVGWAERLRRMCFAA